MAEYHLTQQNIEISGEAMLCNIQAMGRAVVPMLGKYGIDELYPNRWYPQQAWLEILEALTQEVGIDLMSVGSRIAAAVSLPNGHFTIPKLLTFLNDLYRQTHRHCEPPFRAEVIGERKVRIEDSSPYPPDLHFGLIFGLFSRVMPYGANLTVRCEHGGKATIYTVTW